jgi:hypothetical protein
VVVFHPLDQFLFTVHRQKDPLGGEGMLERHARAAGRYPGALPTQGKRGVNMVQSMGCKGEADPELDFEGTVDSSRSVTPELMPEVYALLGHTQASSIERSEFRCILRTALLQCLQQLQVRIGIVSHGGSMILTSPFGPNTFSFTPADDRPIDTTQPSN